MASPLMRGVVSVLLKITEHPFRWGCRRQKECEPRPTFWLQPAHSELQRCDPNRAPRHCGPARRQPPRAKGPKCPVTWSQRVFWEKPANIFMSVGFVERKTMPDGCRTGFIQARLTDAEDHRERMVCCPFRPLR